MATMWDSGGRRSGRAGWLFAAALSLVMICITSPYAQDGDGSTVVDVDETLEPPLVDVVLELQGVTINVDRATLRLKVSPDQAQSLADTFAKAGGAASVPEGGGTATGTTDRDVQVEVEN